MGLLSRLKKTFSKKPKDRIKSAPLKRSGENDPHPGGDGRSAAAAPTPHEQGRPASAQLSPTTKSPPKTYDLDEEKDTVAEQLQQSPPSATAAAASAPSETQEEGKSEHPTSPQSDVEASDAKQQEGNDEEAKHEAPLDTNGATGPTSPLAAAPAPAGPSAEEAAAAGAARKAAKRKKYEPLVMVLGDDVIDQFVSTQWKDRVTALESVMRTVTARTKARKLTRSENNEYDEFLFTAVCKLLEKAIVDRIDAVALAALDLLEAALGGHIPHDFHRVKEALGPLMPSLLHQAAVPSTKVRLQERVITVVVELAKDTRVGPSLVLPYVLAPLPKKKVAVTLQARLLLLLALLPSLGSRVPDVMNLDSMMSIVLAGLEQPDEKIRRIAIAVTVEAYRHFGHPVTKYTTSLSTQQLKKLDAKFAEIDRAREGSGSVPSTMNTPADHDDPLWILRANAALSRSQPLGPPKGIPRGKLNPLKKIPARSERQLPPVDRKGLGIAGSGSRRAIPDPLAQTLPAPSKKASVDDVNIDDLVAMVDDSPLGMSRDGTGVASYSSLPEPQRENGQARDWSSTMPAGRIGGRSVYGSSSTPLSPSVPSQSSKSGFSQADESLMASIVGEL